MDQRNNAQLLFTQKLQFFYNNFNIPHYFLAAHCVFHGTAKVPREKISVQIGRYQLSQSHDESQEHELGEIIIHKDYHHFIFLNDIAILKLATEITYNKFIQPVCLWTKNDDMNSVGQIGTVIGWGTTKDDELSDVLAQGTMPIVSNQVCKESSPDYRTDVTDEMFCAGYRNGTSVCNGDSGGGIFLNIDGAWKIRGIVSFSEKRRDNPDFCNPKRFVVFTDLVKYLDWIVEKIKKVPFQRIDINKLNEDDCGINLDPSKTPEFDKQIFQNYPWMAQLEYDDGPDKRILCHGYLINKRYVLTAASCVTNLTKNKKL